VDEMDGWMDMKVALEVWDGITLPTLWIRLESTKPKFPLKIDDCTKGHIWASLPVERQDVVLEVDPESGMQLTDSFAGPSEDVYPLHVISKTRMDIQGPVLFLSRGTTSRSSVRSKNPHFVFLFVSDMAEKLVVVASQVSRFRALIGSESDPDLKLSDDSYCVLEKVARGRWQGEIQDRSLLLCPYRVDARKFHYLRKSLVRHQLVTLQSYIKRLPSGLQQHSILLMLKRFHVYRRASLMLMTTTTMMKTVTETGICRRRGGSWRRTTSHRPTASVCLIIPPAVCLLGNLHTNTQLTHT
uniref:B-block binding subunit of TFIIIC domain-containing protein n=1 Tax=Salarias fasciatus TaxID=181472 RepID=A0A672GFE5_SALFA